MDEEKLIIVVSKYNELYDFADKNYSNQERKNNCWREISEDMRQPISDCKDRWTRLRDNYRKALKFRKGKSGDAASKVRPYKFEREMSFLKKYLPDRDQKSNIYTEPVSIANSPKAFEDDEYDRIDDTENLTDSEPCTPASSSNSTTFRATPTSVQKKKRKQPRSTQPNSVASVLERYLQTTTATTNSATDSGNNSSLKQFFIAMAETAQSFPPELQIQVKSKIFNIIQEAELKCLQPKDTMQFGNAHSAGFQNFQWSQHLHPQHMQHSHPQHMQHSQSQHIQQSSQQYIQTSQPQHMLASQPKLALLQNMQPQHMQSTSTSFIDSSELHSDNESNLL